MKEFSQGMSLVTFTTLSIVIDFEKLSWLTSEMNIFIYVVIIINMYIFTINILSQSIYLYMYIYVFLYI